MAFNTWLKRLIFIGIFATPFIPLIVSGSMFFPFITGKNFFFRIIVEIITAAWILLALRDSSVRPQKSWIFYAFTVFISVIALADIFGENPYRSFWSNYERMEGFVTHIHLFAYFVVLISVLKSERLWEKFFLTSFGANVAVIGYSIFQLSGVLPINQGGVRVDATFGNTTYLSVYLLFQLFLAVMFILRGGFKESDRMIFPIFGASIGALTVLFVSMFGQVPASIGFVIIFLTLFADLLLFFLTYFSNGKIFLWLLALVDLYLIYKTETRGAILGLIGGIFIASFIVIVFRKNDARARNIAIGIFAGLVALIGIFMIAKDSSFIRSNQTFNRFATISSTEQTTRSRFTIWHMSWEGFKENPVLGWGQDNFIVVFGKYYEPSMWSQEPWFDRSHNVFFDWVIAGGLLGILSYLSLFGAGLWVLWCGSLGFFEKSVLTGLMGAYFAQNLFVFDNLTSYIQFFSLLGIISMFQSQQIVKKNGDKNQDKQTLIAYAGNMFYVAIPALFIVFAAAVYYGNIKPIMASRTLIKAISPQSEVSKNIGYFKEVFALDTFGSGEAREQLVQAAARIRSSGASDADKKNMATLAADEMLKQVKESPTDVRYELYLGSFLNSYGMYDEAIKHLARALELSPKKQPVLFEIGASYINKGNPELALPYFKQVYEDAPTYPDASIMYATGLLYARHIAEAESLLNKVFGTVLVTDNRVLGGYEYLGMYDRIIAIKKLQLEKTPNDQQVMISLAAAYLKIGQRDSAIKTLNSIIEKFPSFKDQGQYFINEIKAGRNP